jgi:hypothetical protein
LLLEEFERQALPRSELGLEEETISVPVEEASSEVFSGGVSSIVMSSGMFLLRGGWA